MFFARALRPTGARADPDTLWIVADVDHSLTPPMAWAIPRSLKGQRSPLNRASHVRSGTADYDENVFIDCPFDGYVSSRARDLLGGC